MLIQESLGTLAPAKLLPDEGVLSATDEFVVRLVEVDSSSNKLNFRFLSGLEFKVTLWLSADGSLVFLQS